MSTGHDASGFGGPQCAGGQGLLERRAGGGDDALFPENPVAERATVVICSVAALERDITRRRCDRTWAMETTGEKGKATQPTVRQPPEKERVIERDIEIGLQR
jgi:hypothetical protein